MSDILPASTDHAFANGGSIERPGPRGWQEWLLGPLAGLLVRANDRRVARAIWRQFETNAVLGEGVRFGYSARIVNLSQRERVTIGANSVVRGVVRVEQNGRVEIGGQAYLGDGTLISAATSVRIGTCALIAHDVQIFDNATHPIDADERRRHWYGILKLQPPEPVPIRGQAVEIGNNCWLGFGAVIMPGSRVGDRSIISAGSIVQGEVPPDVIYRSSLTGAPLMTPIIAK
jgi:acetyltransferase-like isoleucine patch superfamily enzyme